MAGRSKTVDGAAQCRLFLVPEQSFEDVRAQAEPWNEVQGVIAIPADLL
jgi:hypothetical protein